MRLKRTVTVLFLALTMAGGTAFAFTEVTEMNRLEIARPGWGDEGQWIGSKMDAVPGKTSTLGPLTENYGGNWHYNRNTVTGSLHRVYGSGFNFTGPLADESAAERAARDFVDAHASLFGGDTVNLNADRVQRAPGKFAVHFNQEIEGIRVIGGTAHVVITDGGRIFAFGSDAYPGIEEKLANLNPTLSESEAIAIASDDILFLEGRDEITYKELVILPIREGEGELLDLNYRLAWRMDLFVFNPRGHWETYIDAHSGEILWRKSLIFPLDATGHVQGDVEINSYCDGYTLEHPIEGMRIDISGIGTTYCDADGDFSLSYGGTDSKSISADFTGQWFLTRRYTGVDASYSGTITPGTPLTIDWSNANSIDSERNTFSFLNFQHSWLKALDPTFTGMDYAMPDTVERTDGYCPGNAWYDYYGVNFCVGDATYGNTGRMADVIYHEYGHGITWELYRPNNPPSGMHEGNSDIASLLLLREPRLGLGFYLNNCSSGIRNAENTMIYPDDWSETHTGGQILSGFMWDSMQELMAAYPLAYADSVAANGWWYGRKLGLPMNPPDQIYWVFVADDDDGNLDNGTPHHAAFCVGATNHGFDCPEILSPVTITHTPVTEQTSTSSPTAIVANIVSSEAAINESALRVYYRLDGGGYSDVGMSGAGDDYTGNIPAQSAGTFVEYYIYAEDNNTNSATDPSGAPIGLYGFYVGVFETVFEDDFESDLGWTAGVAGDDATTGMWERGDPEGTTYSGQLQPEDDHTPAPGVNCYATQLAAGASAGTYDIDGGKTTLLSPVFDLSDKTLATVSYWRWYSNNQGGSPGNDYWEVQVTGNGSDWFYLENTTSSANSWNQYLFNVGDYVNPLTSTVQFRFIGSDEGDGSLVEAAVDDFLLRAIGEDNVPDPNNSRLSMTQAPVLSPDHNGDSTMTITVEARNAVDDPIPGIPAGDITIQIVGESLLGESFHFCASGSDTLILISAVATDANGQVTFDVNEAGGCGLVTTSAVVQGVDLTELATTSMRSPDFNGNGIVNYLDTYHFIPMLNAGTGYCGNFNQSGDGVVNFLDTVKYLPFLIDAAQCP